MKPSINKTRIKDYLSSHPIGYLFFFPKVFGTYLMEFFCQEKIKLIQTFYFSRINFLKIARKTI